MPDPAPRMEPAAKLLARLRRVGALHFTAHTGQAASLRGQGEGTVLVSCASSHELTFTESGSWRNTAGKSFRFHNVYRWSQSGPATIRLEQQRRGARRAVPLLDLEPRVGATGRWLSATPHVCGDDTYAAELDPAPGGVVLHWTIRGPRKHEHIATEYFFAPPPPS